MAVLKYKNAEGNFVALTNYTVQPIEAVQSTGSSTTDIMSQNAVTTALASKANTSEVYTKNEVNTTFLSKSDASTNYLTKSDASTTYATTTSVTEISNNVSNISSSITDINSSIELINQEIGLGNTGGTSDDPIIRESDLEGYATEDYVDTAVSNLVSGAPETLNTLNELAAALGGDENFSTTVTNQIAAKANSADVYTKAQADELLNNKADSSHTHAINDVTNLENRLAAKSDTGHTHSYAGSSSVGGAATSANKVNSTLSWTVGSSSDSFNGSTAKSFTIPTKLSELTNDVGFVTTTNGTVSVANKVANALTINGNGTSLGVFDGSAETTIDLNYSNVGAAAATHTHTIANITDLQTTLDNKANKSEVYTKTESDNKYATIATVNTINTTVSSLKDAVPTGATSANPVVTKNDLSSYYTKTEVDNTVNGLNTTIGTKANTDDVYSITDANSTFAKVSHEHAISDVTNLQTELNNKSNTSHTHTFAELTSKPTTLSGYGITDANGINVKLSSSYVAVTDMPTVGDGNALSASTTGNTLDAVINRIETNIKLVANEVNENEEVEAEALTDLNNRLDDHVNDTDAHIASEERSNWNDVYNFYEGANSTTSIASVPTSKRLCVVTISASGTFSLASVPSAGREIHIIVKNTASSDITVTMPTASNYVSMSGSELTVTASEYAEINVISDGTSMYIRTL